jgi:tetratricopeptide (TPR) repeat protein
MHPCPSCGAPLDAEGICTSCGALTRSFFRGLDLGAPQIADAVARGLDFYRLLEIESSADTRTIARRYRQLRVYFPDDPSDLAPVPARKLALLEAAGRALTDPRLRKIYDDLRAGRGAELRTEAVRCAGCAAPLPADAARCPFCGTPRPAEPALPAAPPPPAPDDRPPAEPVDYYALLGLTALHLLEPEQVVDLPLQPLGMSPIRRLGAPAPRHLGPPKPADVDAMALACQRDLLLAPGLTPVERDDRVAEIEIARRILRDETRRSQYDVLLRDFRRGQLGSGRLEALNHLHEQARAEIAEERGEQVSEAEGTLQLKQGLGYLSAGLPRDAISPLRRAVAGLPRSAEAHAAYARAILTSEDPLALGAHMLRQALHSLEASASLRAADEREEALAALCRGLLARDEGNAVGAERDLREAVRLDSTLGSAWRGLAAVALVRGALEEALSACRRALAIDRRDERALLMIAAACLRARRHDEAREASAQIATLRGAGWTLEAVLHELGG